MERIKRQDGPTLKKRMRVAFGSEVNSKSIWRLDNPMKKVGRDPIKKAGAPPAGSSGRVAKRKYARSTSSSAAAASAAAESGGAAASGNARSSSRGRRATRKRAKTNFA